MTSGSQIAADGATNAAISPIVVSYYNVAPSATMAVIRKKIAATPTPTVT
jgi:hypothetical protein